MSSILIILGGPVSGSAMSIDLPILDNSVCRRSYGAREMRSRLCAGFLFSYEEGGICPVCINEYFIF